MLCDILTTSLTFALTACRYSAQTEKDKGMKSRQLSCLPASPNGGELSILHGHLLRYGVGNRTPHFTRRRRNACYSLHTLWSMLHCHHSQHLDSFHSTLTHTHGHTHSTHTRSHMDTHTHTHARLTNVTYQCHAQLRIITCRHTQCLP